MNEDLVPQHCWECQCSPRPAYASGGRCPACQRWSRRCVHLRGERTCGLLACARSDALSRQAFLNERCQPARLVVSIARQRPRLASGIEPNDLANEFIIDFLSKDNEIFPELSSPAIGGFRGWVTKGLKLKEQTLRRRERRVPPEVHGEMHTQTINQHWEPKVASYLADLRRDSYIEFLIIMGWAQGSSDREIAEKLGFARETVNRRRHSIFERMRRLTVGNAIGGAGDGQ